MEDFDLIPYAAARSIPDSEGELLSEIMFQKIERLLIREVKGINDDDDEYEYVLNLVDDYCMLNYPEGIQKCAELFAKHDPEGIVTINTISHGVPTIQSSWNAIRNLFVFTVWSLLGLEVDPDVIEILTVKLKNELELKAQKYR